MSRTPDRSPPARPPRRHARPLIAVVAALLSASCASDPGVISITAEPAGGGATAETAIPADERDTGRPDPSEPDGRPPGPDESRPEHPDVSDTRSAPPATAPPATLPPPTEPLLLRSVELAQVAEIGDGKVPRPYDDLVAAALADLEEWMAEIHPAIHGRAWEPLRGGVWPSYPGRTDIPGCGEPATDPADVSEYVAFYCAGRDFMVYDDGPDSLLGDLAEEFGPSILGVVLAHEYAHVAQDRLGDLDRGLPTILTEQQADCVAGAWVARALRGESPYLRLGEADVRGALITMVAVRDPVGIDQFLPGGHGSAFDRIGAFGEGFTDGPRRCAELLDDPLPLMPNEFRTTTDMLNDGDLPFGYEPGDIVPLVVDSLNSFWSFALEQQTAGPSGGLVPLAVVPVDAPTTCPGGRTTEVATGLVLCPDRALVLLDDAFARRLYQDPIIGRADFAVGYLVGLAWAEMVQQLLDSPLERSARAIGNDCLVGAWANDLDPRRPDRPGETGRAVISPGDLDEAVVAAIELSDARSDEDRLGGALDKIDSFRRGVLGGLDPCLELIGR